MKRLRNTRCSVSVSVFAAARSHLGIESLEPRAVLAADTIDALVISPTDEASACVWTPTDAMVAVSTVDATIAEDRAAVPRIATDLVPLTCRDLDPIYSIFDPSDDSPMVVVVPTGGFDGTDLLTDGTTQGIGDSFAESGDSNDSVDGNTAGAVDVRVQFVSSDVGWAAYYYSVAGDGAVTGVSVYASYDEPNIAAFVAEHADDATVQISDCGDGWWIDGFPPELAPPVPAVDPNAETNWLTGGATDDSVYINAADAADSGHELPTDPTAEPPAWVVCDWGGVPMVEDTVGLSVAQPPVESLALNFSEAPGAFAVRDQLVGEVSPESRAAAFATLPVSAQANAASMYAAFAAWVSQSSSDGQGSGAFAGAKRSTRR